MTNCLFGWNNALLAATLTASAEVAGLNASQLQTPHGSTATAWQTPVGVTSASLLADLLGSVSIGALSLHKTNLTPEAAVRWRAGPAEALVERVPDIVAMPRPGWTPPAGWSYTRSGTAYGFDAAGLLVTYPANTPRWAYDDAGSPIGILFEGTRINRVLRNRDLTNAVWTKTNCTAALAATGLDGVANSASTLTATAANATCMQAITHASTGRVLTFYLRRRTGTGGVDITLDGGTTWTPVTLTGGLQRFSATQTLANPTVGIRLQVSGDAVDVDVAQLEDGSTPSSPIINNAAANTRLADSVVITSGLIASGGTLFAEATSSVGAVWVQLRDAGGNNIVRTNHGATTTTVAVIQGGSNVSGFATPAVAAPNRVAANVDASSVTGATNGASLGTYAGAIAPMDRIEVAPNGGSAVGIISAIRYWGASLTTGQAVALTGAGAGVSTLDPAALSYDSGTIPAGIAAGYGQSVILPPGSPSGRYVRLDVTDPQNPESCLRIAQAFIGPVARPMINFDFPTTFKRDVIANRYITRGGQKYVEPRFAQRAWRVALTCVAEADVWPLVQELQRAAEDGRNILFVPFPLGAEVAREAVFGTLEDPSELAWQQRIATWRSWSATVVERN